MKGRFLLSLLLTALGAAACSESGAPPETDVADVIAIEGAALWDGTGAPLVADSVILIEGDRIRAVGPRSDVTVPEGASRIDATGQTVIPGIINAHGHAGMTRGLVQDRANYTRENILEQLELYGRYGVTTVLSLGLDFGPMFEIRGPASPDEPPRATVLTAGRGFTGRNGYPAVLPDLTGVPVEVDSRDEIRTHIQELADQDVDFVKIWVDDHFGHYDKIRPELYQAIIEEAHAAGLPVMAHVFYLEDAKGLVRAGVDGLAHSVRDQEVDDELIDMLRANDVFVAATLSREESTSMYSSPPAFLDEEFFARYADPEVIRALKDPAYGAGVREDPDYQKNVAQFAMAKTNLKKLYDADVRLVFGTDTGPPARFQGYFEHRELDLMSEVGIPPADILKIATLRSAEALGIAEDFGSLETGKRADFILLDASPLDDIRNAHRIHQVWIGGRALE